MTTTEITYESPIHVLEGNILDSFINIDPSVRKFLEESVANEKVNKNINYIHNREGLKTPFATQDGSINIQVLYLEYLWSFIYSTFVLYEVECQGSILASNNMPGHSVPDGLLDRATALYNWSISLKNNVSNWDSSLPNPKLYTTSAEASGLSYSLFEKEKWFAEKANKLFVGATSFLLFHEFAHLALNHLTYYKNRTKSELEDLSEGEKSELIQLENEADRFALERVLRRNGNHREILVSSFPIVITICSSIAFIKKPINIKQSRHPSLSDRLLHLINDFNLFEEVDQDYVWLYAVNSLYNLINKHNLPINIALEKLLQSDPSNLEGIKLLNNEKIEMPDKILDRPKDLFYFLNEALDNYCIKNES